MLMKNVTSDGRNLVKKILKIKPRKRLTMTDVLQQQWMRDAETLGKVQFAMDCSSVGSC